MGNIIDSFKLTLFELVGYVLPGLFFELTIFLLFFPSRLSEFTGQIPILVILSYLIGQVLHSISSVLDIEIKDIQWKIYHLLKETDEKGHGVDEPRYILGNFAKRLRTYIEMNNPKGVATNTNQILRDKLGLDDLSNFDLFFMKESILAESGNIATNFEHLHYQKIFNRSMAFCFACLTLLIPFLHFLNTESAIVLGNKFLGLNANLCLLTIASGIFYKVFYGRSKFFKTYRDKVMDSAVRIYLETNFRDEKSIQKK